MVIRIIDIERVALDEAENHPPIRTNGDGPHTLQLAFQWMQAETRQVHIADRTGGVKSRENVSQLNRVFP
jgi:hypothetical protein